MANLKLRIRKTVQKVNVNGVVKSGFIGRVLTNGTKTWDEIAMEACRNTTVHKAEMKTASELLIDAIRDTISQGFIVDLGPIGKLYPSVTGKWSETGDDLSLSDLKPKVNYKPGADIEAAVKGAQLSWTTEAETAENSVSDDEPDTGGDQGGNQGGSGSDGLEG